MTPYIHKCPERFLEPGSSKHGCYVQGFPSFSLVSNHKKTGHNSNGRRYKSPGIFHRGLEYWESDGTIAVALSRDFYHRDFKRKFPLEHLSSLDCSHMFYERVRTSFSYSHVYVLFAHDVITRISLSVRDKPMRLAL